MTLALLGNLATVLYSCPSVSPPLIPILTRPQCPILPIKSFSNSSYVSSLLASGCILSFLLGPYICHLPLHWLAFYNHHYRCLWYSTGSHYWRLDSSKDGWHSWPIVHQWPKGPSTVDAAFSWDDKLYLIQVCIRRDRGMRQRLGECPALW